MASSLQQYFNGKKVIVSGGAAGVGRHLVERLHYWGAAVSVLDIDPVALEDLKLRRPFIKIFQVDVSDVTAVESAIAESLKDWAGNVDILVCCAGVGSLNPGSAFDRDLDRRVMEINYFGTVNLVSAVLPVMLRQRAGQIIGISSLAALRGLPRSASYCASKAAQTTFLESLRVDLRDFGIRVGCIHPGFIATAMAEHNAFWTPFKLTPDVAALKVLAAIQRQQTQVYFPWLMGLLARFQRLLPNWLYDLISQRAGRQIKAGEGRIFSHHYK